jgi:hypothetical protein
MRLSRQLFHILGAVIFLVVGLASAQADQGNREVLPFESMAGVISGTLEPAKLLLSSNDKIIIDLNKALGIKPGDYVEIFQPLDLKTDEKGKPYFRKVGLAIVIEKINETKAIGIIDSSVKEISVGDLVLVVNPR